MILVGAKTQPRKPVRLAKDGAFIFCPAPRKRTVLAGMHPSCSRLMLMECDLSTWRMLSDAAFTTAAVYAACLIQWRHSWSYLTIHTTLPRVMHRVELLCQEDSHL